MNSTIGASRLAALAMCGAAVVGCDSIKDVRESPTYAVPPEKVSITGRITGDGVGTTRPVGLKIEVRGDKLYAVDNDDELDDGQRIDIIDGEQVRSNFFSLRGVNVVNFGAADIGATYVVSVTSQPFGRVCSVENGSGTVTAAVSNIEVRCVRDSTPLYHVNVGLAPGLAAAPPPGFKLRLTTEEGVQEITPEPGAATVAFTMPVIYPGANPPLFAYRVSASYEENGMTNNCAVTNGSGELGTGAGDINDVMVTACGFSIAAVASYSAPPGVPPGPPPALGAGLELGLKDTSGEIVATTGQIAAFSPLPVAFPGSWASNPSALYEVTVISQPAGQFCTVDNGGQAALAAGVDVTAQVRCRNTPAEANRLTGTYQVLQSVPDASEENPRPLATSPNRHFMTFFANGTFIYGVHHSSTAAGVEHGFYNYNPVAQTLDFSVYTDSSNFPGPVVCRLLFADFSNNCPSSVTFGAITTVGAGATGGLTGLSGYVLPTAFGADYIEYGPPALPAVVSATGVVKTAPVPAEDPTPELPGDAILPAIGQQINLTFGATSWTLVEPISSTWGLAGSTDYWAAGETNGAWVTADSKRVWVYDKGTTYGWHAGVNGGPNLQDMCFGIEQGGGALGYETFYSRRIAIPNDAFSSSCTPFGPSAGGVVDVPSAFSNPVLIPGFAGRFPGASTSTVLPPSPAYFRVAPGASFAADTLTVQGTSNGQVTEDPLVLNRSVSN